MQYPLTFFIVFNIRKTMDNQSFAIWIKKYNFALRKIVT